MTMCDAALRSNPRGSMKVFPFKQKVEDYLGKYAQLRELMIHDREFGKHEWVNCI